MPKFNIGDKVHYHPIIGKPHNGKVYEITDIQDTPSIKSAVYLKGKSGCVSQKALSKPA